jgi:hypothetical protein
MTELKAYGTYCRHHWDWRSDEQEGLDSMMREIHDPLTEEEKQTFEVEEVK